MTTDILDKPYFVRQARADDSLYYILTADAPDWLREAVYQAHDDEAPNDWRYETCADIWEGLMDAIKHDMDLDDFIHTAADDCVPIYTHELTTWLDDNPSRMAYMDEYIETIGRPSDSDELLRGGIYLCVYRMASILVDAYRDNV